MQFTHSGQCAFCHALVEDTEEDAATETPDGSGIGAPASFENEGDV